MENRISKMDHVKVTIHDLLTKLRTNRGTHREIFERAQKGYRAAMIEELDRMLKEAASGGKIIRGVSMPEPEDHTDDYDRAILMLDMCVDKEVFITATEFECLVMDNWGWSRSFTASNNSYIS